MYIRVIYMTILKYFVLGNMYNVVKAQCYYDQPTLKEMQQCQAVSHSSIRTFMSSPNHCTLNKTRMTPKGSHCK